MVLPPMVLSRGVRKTPRNRTPGAASGGRKSRGRPAEAALQQRPVEARSGVGLAPGRDMLMARNPGDRIAPRQRLEQRQQRVVLRRLERAAFEALQLDADRVVVAVGAALPLRGAGMPGALIAGDELQQFAVATDDE